MRWRDPTGMRRYRARLRCPRLCCGKLCLARLRQLRAGQRAVSQALVEDALEGDSEPRGVTKLALVETEGLLVQIPKQMERFNRHVGAFDGAFQETPEVFHTVGVDGAFSVAVRVVDDVVDVLRSFAAQVLVRAERVRVDGRALLNVL